MYNSGIISQILEEEGINPSAISLFAGIMIVYFVVLGVISLALYLLESFALFNMAKSAGYSRPWRGFIPFANTFLFGKIAEKYRKRDGKPSAKFGGLLLAVEIIMVVLSVVLVGFCIKFIIDIFGFANMAVETDTALTAEMFASVIPVILLSLAEVIFSITYIVLFYVALWRIFAAYDYSNATLFLVLSIFFTFLAPIFLFVMRKNQPVFDPSERFNYLLNNNNQE